MLSRTLFDVIRGYLNNKANNTEEKYVSDLMESMQGSLKTATIDEKADLIQQLIFINLVGYDVSWADFTVLEVMSSDSYSNKRVAYTAATQMWNTKSDAVLMATNRIQRDLTSVIPLVANAVLTSLPPYLSLPLSQHIAHDVIALMSGARPQLRQKAIMTFYHICLKYPDALRPGFTALRNRLDDSDVSVVFSALTVMSELCAHNPANFGQLIPKFHKMLETSPSNWISVRLITILRMLCAVEPRLPRKLINPFTTILETTSSITVLFECVRTIIDVPILNPTLLSYATQRMQAFLEHKDTNLRFLCLTLFIKLIRVQPSLVATHKELITQCLDSSDEATRMLALDLLAALANDRTVDGIVAKLFEHFRASKSAQFRDQILTRVVDICSRDDYELITDFEWYITVLVDFLEEGGFTAYHLIADQFLDMAQRVPATRETLIALMAALFENVDFKDKTRLLLVAAFIIGEYSDDPENIQSLLQPLVLSADERVQTCCLDAAFKLYLRVPEDSRPEGLSEQLCEGAALLAESPHAEVQDRAQSILELVQILSRAADFTAFEELKGQLATEQEEDEEPIERPAGLDAPVELFAAEDEVEPEEEKPSTPLAEAARKKRRHRTQTEGDDSKPLPTKVRHQQHSAVKPEILSKGRKTTQTAKPKPQSNAISDALATVDLSGDIAEAEVLPRPMPYNQDELTRRAEINSHRRHRSHGHRRTKEIQQTQQAPPPPPAVTGPKPRSRMQLMGENSSLIVNAVEFTAPADSPGRLEVELQIHNQTAAVVTAIDITVQGSGVKGIDVPSITQQIQPVSSVSHKIVLEFANPMGLSRVRVIFVPVDGPVETLEGQLRVYPSCFLNPAPAEELEGAMERCQHVSKIRPEGTVKARDVLQTAVNVLRGTMIKTESTTRAIFAKAAGGEEIIGTVQASVGAAFVELKGSDEALVRNVSKELEAKIRALAQ